MTQVSGTELAIAVHPHPTVSEVLGEAAHDLLGHPIHVEANGASIMARTRTATTAAAPDIVEAWIEQDELKPGRHNARLTTGPRVWLVIGTLQRLNWDTAKTANEWMIPEEAVRAAICYFEQHRALFDAKLLLEAEKADV